MAWTQSGVPKGRWEGIGRVVEGNTILKFVYLIKYTNCQKMLQVIIVHVFPSVLINLFQLF